VRLVLAILLCLPLTAQDTGRYFAAIWPEGCTRVPRESCWTYAYLPDGWTVEKATSGPSWAYQLLAAPGTNPGQVVEIPGPPGPTGPQGIQGATGPQGERGPQGIQGVPGSGTGGASYVFGAGLVTSLDTTGLTRVEIQPGLQAFVELTDLPIPVIGTSCAGADGLPLRDAANVIAGWDGYLYLCIPIPPDIAGQRRYVWARTPHETTP
jgi:hypothetical protein